MKKLFRSMLLALAIAVVSLPSGCTRKQDAGDQEQQGVGAKGAKALQWKKGKENELTGENATEGE